MKNFLLLQFLCAVLAVRAGNFLGAPRVTSYSTPAYTSFAVPPFSAPALASYPTQAFSTYGSPTYSSYASAPLVTKNYGQVSSYSTQNAPVTYSRPTIVAAAPVNTYTASSYSNYPQRTPITTFSASGPGTYTYPLPYSSQVPVTTYTTSPVLESAVTYTTAPAVSYNGLTANIRL